MPIEEDDHNNLNLFSISFIDLNSQKLASQAIKLRIIVFKRVHLQLKKLTYEKTITRYLYFLHFVRCAFCVSTTKQNECFNIRNSLIQQNNN